MMPLAEFPVDMRAEIERLAQAPSPPSKWLNLGEFAQIPSRAWFEWHLRRGVDPRKRRDKIPAATRASVIARDGNTCGLCNGTVEQQDIHIDHIIPVSRGGGNHAGNLQVTHAACNLRKGNRA